MRRGLRVSTVRIVCDRREERAQQHAEAARHEGANSGYGNAHCKLPCVDDVFAEQFATTPTEGEAPPRTTYIG
jgi:hypothetical protein